MRYLFALLFLLTAACQNDPSDPSLAPVEPTLAEYNPLYPNAPICNSGSVNGAFLVRLHSYWTHNPPSVTWNPSSTGEERKIAAEVYSYYTTNGSICRNMHGLVVWDIVNPPSSNWVTEEEPFYIHSRIEQFRHIFGSGNGSDKVIAQVGPRQTCCPLQHVSGVAADTIITYWTGF